jgi:hypothetical protein
LWEAIGEKGPDGGLEQIQSDAAARWQSLGFGGAGRLLWAKSYYLLGETQHMTYNLRDSYPFFGSGQTVRVVCALYWWVVLAPALVWVYRVRGRGKPGFAVFVSVFTLALFLASIFLEVYSRYFSVFFPAFTLFAALGAESALLRAPEEKDSD